MFALKKFVSAFLLPFQFALAAGLAGLLLSLGRRWRRTGQALMAAALLTLLVTGNRWLSARLIAPLESRFPAIANFRPGDALPASLAASVTSSSSAAVTRTPEEFRPSPA